MKTPGEDVVVRTIESALEGKPSAQSLCLNCEASLNGAYCSRCGQRAGDLHITLGEFLRDALDSLFSLDSRLWRTLAMLLGRPGLLTVEYWAGRRVRFLPPLRLYLFVSFVSFLLISAFDTVEVVDTSGGDDALIRMNTTTGDEVNWDEDFDEAPPAVQWLMQRLVRPATEQPERLRELFFQRLPWAIFLMVPFFAAMLRVLFRKVDRYLVPHLIFSLHFHTATFVFLALGAVGDWALATDAASSVASLAIAVTLYFSLRRAYGDGRIKTLIKELILGGIHITMLGIALLVTFAVTSMGL